ncbi:hypothetical protein VTJ83DRAFT_7261 [Remersonia thermophila]|uniref:HD/PDEase domain-containing protein n=1 Tax=Remersonia thermophila TaxID=72144 RepID=A0ABR4D2Z1_9PEZI
MPPSIVSAMSAFEDDPLVQGVQAFVKEYMSRYDSSHDWHHVERVVAMAHHIYNNSDPAFQATLDLRTIHLAALLHDVGDHKYLPADQTPTSELTTLLASLSCPADLALALESIIPAVSYTSETRALSTPSGAAAQASLLQAHPELAVVRDSDRLDAMGAVGLARMFAFGAVKGGGRSLAESMEHLDEKLVKLEGMMRTEAGKKEARVRGERLRMFREWWVDEVGEVGRG